MKFVLILFILFILIISITCSEKNQQKSEIVVEEVEYSDGETVLKDYLAYAKFDVGIDDGADWIRKKLNRTWNKINPEIRYLVEEKYKSAMNTVTKKETQL